jgi:hypothetical protein
MPVECNVPSEDITNAALEILERVARDAVWSGEHCTWNVEAVGDSARGQFVTWRLAQHDLYQGASGIALLMAEAFGVTRELEYRRCATGALLYAASVADRLPATSFGWCNGRVGVAYALARAARITNEDLWRREALRILAPLFGREREDEERDLIGGAAGAIPALLLIDAWLDCRPAGECALKLGHMLLECANRRTLGWSWPSPFWAVADDLTGYSHGTSGFGHALLELYRAYGLPEFRYAAEEAFRYERCHYSAIERNWPDLRRSNVGGERAKHATEAAMRLSHIARSTPIRCESRYLTLWCHGAPGIGLARLRAFDITGDPEYAEEARIAAYTTEESLTKDWESHMPNYSLCHGYFGNCETLLRGARSLNEPRWHHVVVDFVAHAVDRFRGRQWPSGTRVPDPSLFLGECGVAHFLLRMVHPEIPSVLLLEPMWLDPRKPEGRDTTLPEPSGVPREVVSLRRSHVSAHFGLTLAVAEQYPAVHTAIDRIVLNANDRAPVHTTFAMLDAHSKDAAAHFQDAFKLDRAVYELANESVDRVAWYLSQLVRPLADAVDWRHQQFALPSHVRLVVQQFDWDTWAQSDRTSLPIGADQPLYYAAFRQNHGHSAIVRLEPWESAWLALCAEGAIGLDDSRASAFMHTQSVSLADLLVFVQAAYAQGMLE